MDLSIIIVSWNVSDLLKKCIDSIYKHTQGISFEVFVIDNASADKTAEMVKGSFGCKSAGARACKRAGVKSVPNPLYLISNQTNRGFAAANNQGIKKAKGDYILLLNPDTELKEDSLTKMVNFMKNRPQCGIAGCHLLNPDGSAQDSVRGFPGFLDQTLILLKFHHIFPHFFVFRRYLYQNFDYEKESSVDQVMGAAFMIRRQVIKQIGLLDENFFIWFEEVDYCLRAKSAGWQIVYTPTTSIIHHFGQSFKQVMTVKKQKIWNKSLRYYFLKHHSLLEYVMISILTWVSLGLVYITSVKLKVKSVKPQLKI
jgi:GT2 family glycosyltransferase